MRRHGFKGLLSVGLGSLIGLSSTGCDVVKDIFGPDENDPKAAGRNYFGDVVKYEDNGASYLGKVGMVKQPHQEVGRYVVNRSRHFVEVVGPFEVVPDSIWGGYFEVGSVGKLGSMEQPEFTLHSLPSGWDYGSGESNETDNNPDTHHSHFSTLLENPDGEAVYFKSGGHSLRWNGGGANWNQACVRSGFESWEDFLGGNRLEEQPVVGIAEYAPGETVFRFPLDREYLRDRVKEGEDISFMIRSRHDLVSGRDVYRDPELYEGEIAFFTENAEHVHQHPRLVIELRDRDYVVTHDGRYFE
ncbi:hypothetical protein CMO92_04585 [Candidatus Woesearchaeota archaeon]|nr:hypothetical protein [Candidatus Woesearchaeota archaeon]|tara:strand:+ start:263 stop:1165 length:903 start_codon:yes stop_codon:yes gene_type:complete